MCLVLGRRLQYQPLGDWVKWELEGYPPEVEVPEYRRFTVVNKGNFQGAWRGVFEIPLYVLPEELRDKFSGHEVRDSISEFQDLLKRAADHGSLRIPWPVELAIQYCGKHVRGSQCVSAWMEVSPSAMAALLDQVTTRILDFALKIEADFPNAGDVGGLTVRPTEAALSQTFNTTINGSVQNYAAGSNNVEQAAISIAPGDLPALVQELKKLGVTDEDLRLLPEALDDDQKAGAGGVGPAVKKWLGSATSKVAQGVVSGTITKLVLAFLGIGGP